MLKGIPVSEGIGIGRAYIIKKTQSDYENKPVENKESEKTRLQKAIQTFCEKNEELAKRMENSSVAKEAEIIRGHAVMLNDPFMISQMEENVDTGMCAEAACESVLNRFKEIFLSAEDELTRQRAADIEDIKSRLLAIMTGTESNLLSELPDNTILVAEELTPSMTAEIDKDKVCGIITEKGGKTSHSAILARAMGIPAVLSVPNVLSKLVDGLDVIIDGEEGVILEDPDEKEKKEYIEKLEVLIEEKQIHMAFANRKTITADGIEKSLFCNVGKLDDAVTAVEKSGEGIGLFRTEFLFMGRDSAPDEQLQFETYKKAAQLFPEGEVIVRTLDVGGDKAISYLEMEQEENPFLGFRAIRYCLHNTELFRTQLKAAVRASAFGKIAIMVPLVTQVEEIRAVRALVDTIKKELENDGTPYDANIKIGAMIETPAAGLIADILAEECDFFSIGTNDLTQYTMASDRGNSKISYLNNYFEPAVLRLIRHIIQCGNRAGIPVGMCGEAAADPMMTPLLISFGLDEFSVSPGAVLKTRYNISKWSKKDADKVTETVMKCKTAAEVMKILKYSQNKYPF